MNGIYKELQKQFGSSVPNYIVAARTAQGYEELATSTQQQRLDVVKRWQATQLELHNEKERVKHNTSNPPNCVFLRMKNATHSNVEEKRNNARKGKLHKAPTHSKHESSARRKGAETMAAPPLSVSASSLEHADTSTFEEAIQSSVKATSRGDPEQDALIERAIRASVVELRAASKAGDEDQALQRAIQASVAEASEARKAIPTRNTLAPSVSDDGLRLSLQRSLSYHPSAGVHTEDELDEPGLETGEEDVKSAFEEPKGTRVQSDDHDIQLKNAMEESRLDHEQQVKDLEKGRTEEQVVLEYVKKQSLLEEEHRRSLASKANATPE